MTKATVIPREYDGIRQDGELVRGAVNVAEAVCRLPAIPASDWCDKAAAALAGVHGSCSSVLLVCALDGVSSRIGSMTACGVSVRGMAGRDGEALTGEIRSRLDRLTGSDWMPSPRADGGTPTNGDFFSTRQAVSPSHADLWRQLGWPDVLAASTPIDGTPRSVVAYLAPGPGVVLTRAHSVLLAAALGLLARRSASMPWPTRPGGWISPSEQQVLDRLVLGKSVREVADELERSPHTVHDHVKSLHRKLQASTRGELVAKALGYAPARTAPAAADQGAGVPVAG